jgi:hypothetical protein
MKLKDYILEYVSSGRRKQSRNNISIDMNTTMEEMIDMLEELGYVNMDSSNTLSSLSFFEDGPKRYAIRVSNTDINTKRVLVKNNDKSKSAFIRLLFRNGKNISPEFMFLDRNGDVDSKPTDFGSIEEYITGK